jgi:putative tricarboxylic transport membrane protein
MAPVIGRQSVQGFFIGVLPGAGATIASFLGYAVERNIAKGEEQAEFGKGSSRGSPRPRRPTTRPARGPSCRLLTLGIPGSGTTAILLGALIALNVTPGPRLMTDTPEIFWAVIISMFIGNLVLLILNLPLIPYIAKILTIPRNFLIPFILFFTLMGAYIGQNNATELLILVGLGVWRRSCASPTTRLRRLLIGFILGTMLEDNFARSMQLYRGLDFILERPMTLALLVLALLLVLLPSYRARRARRRAEGVADGD